MIILKNEPIFELEICHLLFDDKIVKILLLSTKKWKSKLYKLRRLATPKFLYSKINILAGLPIQRNFRNKLTKHNFVRYFLSSDFHKCFMEEG